MPVQKTCSVCGKEFTAANARAETAKTCSRACKGQLTAKAYEAQRVKRECLKCGAAISVSVGRAERGNGMYCGRACKDLAAIGNRFIDLVGDGDEIAASPRTVYRSCERCGASFTKKRSEVERGSTRFCSMTCFRGSQGASGLPAKIPKSCLVCGKDFIAERWQVLLGRGRYCSDPCRIKFLATTHTKE